MHSGKTPASTSRADSREITPATHGAFPFGHLQLPWLVAERLPISELNVEGFTPLQIQLLHNRGIDKTEFSTFWNADWHSSGPSLMDLDKAVARIQAAIAKREHIVVYGDYDCDGITSCALLTSSLQLLGADVTPYVPTREDDGRGLNLEAIQALAGLGTTLLVTTDCGSANVDEAQLARSLGMQVIVTDHHPLHGVSAEVLALLNPQRPDDLSTNKDLSGVGVTFRLAEALANTTGNSTLQKRLPALLDLVAIGTIADVVPLTKENWALAHAGLAVLKAAPRPGIAALAERTGLNPGLISERDISFAIAPRLNAAGRLGRPQVALEILLTADLQEARRLAEELDALNSERQHITEDVLREAREQVVQASGTSLPPVLIIRGNNWPLGILGLVAGRLADDYHRPTFVISSGQAESRGSARGRSDVDLGKLLADWPGEFKRFGGHAQAAGFTVGNSDLEHLTSYIYQVFVLNTMPTASVAVTEVQVTDELQGAPAPIPVDCLLPLSSITHDRYSALRMLAPFGGKFPEPVFVSTGLKILRCWQSGPDGRNLRLVLGDKHTKVSFLWSRQGSLFANVQSKMPWLPLVDVVYTLDGYSRRDGSFEVMPRILTMRPVEN